MKDLSKLVDQVALPDTYKFNQYDEINSELLGTPTSIRFIDKATDKHSVDAPAYTTRRNAVNNTGDYIITIYKDNITTISRQFLLMHEYGHIRYSHLINFEITKNIFISNNKNKVDVYRKVMDVKDYDVSDEELLTAIFNKLDNISADLEVNSKVFSFDEFLLGCKSLGIVGIHPEQYEFEEGLTQLQYLRLLMEEDNLNEILNSFSLEMKSSDGSDGDGSSGQSSQSEGQGDGNEGEGNGDGSSGSDVKSKLNKWSNKGSIGCSISESDEISKDQGKSDSGNSDESNSSSNNSSDQGRGIGNSGSANRSMEIKLGNISKNILKFLASTAVTNSIDYSRNTLFNYNRRIFGKNNNIIIPRELRISKENVNNLVFLVDVSSSMNNEIINKACATVIEFYRTGVNKSTGIQRLITCNTRVIEDIDLNKVKASSMKLRISGGTHLANGIHYIINQLHLDKANTVFYILSDMEDSLDDWDSALDGNKFTNVYGLKIQEGYGNDTKYRNFSIIDLVNKRD